jgi:hypothetical protein
MSWNCGGGLIMEDNDNPDFSFEIAMIIVAVIVFGALIIVNIPSLGLY